MRRCWWGLALQPRTQAASVGNRAVENAAREKSRCRSGAWGLRRQGGGGGGARQSCKRVVACAARAKRKWCRAAVARAA